MSDEIARKLDELTAAVGSLSQELKTGLQRLEKELRDDRKTANLWQQGVNDQLELLATHLGVTKKANFG